jgi:UDP:flavonoid glycosyltransferase YjiC (YdhE family)
VWDAGNFYVESVAAAQKLGRRAVLLIGHDPLNLPQAPFGKRVITVPYAQHAHLFPRASVVVHHGGIGTTGHALRAGKPALIVPYGGDQFDNGARVERLGVGRVLLRKYYRAERVAVELRQLLENPSYRTAATAIGQQIQREDGVGAACDAIEKQLQTKRDRKESAGLRSGHG